MSFCCEKYTLYLYGVYWFVVRYDFNFAAASLFCHRYKLHLSYPRRFGIIL